ncbi:hypothetical protein [Brevibacillus brevis]|uniref:YggT family protein n=1 Tax=Brevibacillus brevis TaxID=1393 RepID=A0ABY9TCM7_BREBE|nr:hypothetical protein [Brevibacillus brevis]WNC17865.1 hypothetical protein RGB73_30055 [Brevibacillus brevis]
MQIGQFFIDLLNKIIEGLGAILSLILQIFPDSPFSQPSSPPSSVNLGYITWLFDFPTWLSHIAALLTCLIVYYSVRVVARWVKLIRS